MSERERKNQKIADPVGDGVVGGGPGKVLDGGYFDAFLIQKTKSRRLVDHQCVAGAQPTGDNSDETVLI